MDDCREGVVQRGRVFRLVRPSERCSDSGSNGPGYAHGLTERLESPMLSRRLVGIGQTVSVTGTVAPGVRTTLGWSNEAEDPAPLHDTFRSRPCATPGKVSRGKSHGSRKLCARGDVEMICDGVSREDRLSLFLRRNIERRHRLRIGIRYGLCRAERNRVALRRRRIYAEIARRVVERVAVDRRTGLLENRSR